MNELVSVVIPTYNAEKYVKKTIDSVLNQSFRSIEIIVIDDYSSDGTKEILEKITDRRIRLFCHQANFGVANTRNEGIELANGDYIIFMDDDDIMPYNRVKNHVEFFEKHLDIIAVGGKVFDIDSSDNVTGIWNPVVVSNPRYIKAKLLQCGVYINGAVTYRRKTIIENGLRFEDKAFGLEDYDFMVRISKIGKISGIDVPVLLYRRHKSNTEKIVLKTQPNERKRYWKKIFKYAYSKEGFDLSEDDYDVLLEVFDETNKDKPSNELYGKFLIVLSELESQINKINPENTEELLTWIKQCRRDYC